jgi:hypothetical protein
MLECRSPPDDRLADPRSTSAKIALSKTATDAQGDQGAFGGAEWEDGNGVGFVPFFAAHHQ